MKTTTMWKGGQAFESTQPNNAKIEIERAIIDTTSTKILNLKSATSSRLTAYSFSFFSFNQRPAI